MRRDELDLQHGTWTIPGARTKNGRAHMVPLAPLTAALIEQAIAIGDAGHEKPTPYVFPSPRDRDRPINPAALSHALRDARLALKLDDARPHDLRRTAATIMASERLGISPFLIGRMLNHTTETGGAAMVTVSTYAVHDYAQEKRRALAAWEGLLHEITDGRAPSTNVTFLRAN